MAYYDPLEIMLSADNRAAYEREYLYPNFVERPKVSIFENTEDYFYISHFIEAGVDYWIRYEIKNDTVFVLEEGHHISDEKDVEYIRSFKKKIEKNNDISE